MMKILAIVLVMLAVMPTSMRAGEGLANFEKRMTRGTACVESAPVPERKREWQ